MCTKTPNTDKTFGIITRRSYGVKNNFYFYQKRVALLRLFVYNNISETHKLIYRGVEQLVARRAHNPKVVGSSPSSATKKNAVDFVGCYFFGMMPPLAWLMMSLDANDVDFVNDVCFARFKAALHHFAIDDTSLKILKFWLFVNSWGKELK